MENWTKLVGYPEYEESYEVSDSGNIRSVDRLIVDSIGRKTFYKGTLLQPSKNRSGYMMINFRLNGSKLPVVIHRVVAKAFVDKVEGKDYVNHKDGDKENNKKENLEWCTSKENKEHSIKLGTTKIRFGEQSPNNKLTSTQVIDIKERLINKETYKSIAEIFNVNYGTIGAIKNKLIWKHI